MRYFLLITFLLYARILFAQGGTEIYLLSLNWNGDSAKTTNNLVNCTNNNGYDSQPFFEDNNSFLFTSMRNEKTADIYRYKINSKETTSVSQHPDAEYSPKRGFKKNKITVVKGAEQNITMFNLDGSNPEVVVKHKDSIGYYAYFQKGFLCFILSNPPTLQYVSAANPPEIIDTVPGRNLYKYNDGVFYEKEITKDKFMIRYMSSSKQAENIIELPNGIQDFFADEAGTLYCINNNKLYSYYTKQNTRLWKLAASFEKENLKKITRFALSPDKSKLLIVTEE